MFTLAVYCIVHVLHLNGFYCSLVIVVSGLGLFFRVSCMFILALTFVMLYLCYTYLCMFDLAHVLAIHIVVSMLV